MARHQGYAAKQKVLQDWEERLRKDLRGVKTFCLLELVTAMLDDEKEGDMMKTSEWVSRHGNEEEESHLTIALRAAIVTIGKMALERPDAEQACEEQQHP